MTRDEARSIHLLFGEELALGEIDVAALRREPAVLAAVRSGPVPSRISRRLQARAVAGGSLDLLGGVVAPMVAAREAVLGDAARGPARVLVRLSAFPHPGAYDTPDAGGLARADALLRDAGIPYLLPVVPHVAQDPFAPSDEEFRTHAWAERALLDAYREHPERIAVGVGGLDHRTRQAKPERRTELGGLRRKALVARLDRADAAVRAAGFPSDVLVPPWDRFDAEQWLTLAPRYEVVTGGPGSLRTMGWHRAPLWRGDAVWLPTHAPLSGPADAMLATVAELAAREPALWVPLTLDWRHEQATGWAGLERLAPLLAGLARPWDEFLAAVRASRTAA